MLEKLQENPELPSKLFINAYQFLLYCFAFFLKSQNITRI